MEGTYTVCNAMCVPDGGEAQQQLSFHVLLGLIFFFMILFLLGHSPE